MKVTKTLNVNNYQEKKDALKKSSYGVNIFLSFLCGTTGLVLFFVLGIAAIGLFILVGMSIFEFIVYGQFPLLKDVVQQAIEFKWVVARAGIVLAIMAITYFIIESKTKKLNEKTEELETLFALFWSSRLNDKEWFQQKIAEVEVKNGLFVLPVKLGDDEYKQPKFILLYVLQTFIKTNEPTIIGRTLEAHLTVEDGKEKLITTECKNVGREEVMKFMNCDVDAMKKWNDLCENRGSKECKLQF